MIEQIVYYCKVIQGLVKKWCKEKAELSTKIVRFFQDDTDFKNKYLKKYKSVSGILFSKGIITLLENGSGNLDRSGKKLIVDKK